MLEIAKIIDWKLQYPCIHNFTSYQRGGFASAALSVVNAFFDDNEYESDDSHQEFARSALESWEFLYCDVFTTKDGEVSVLLLKWSNNGLLVVCSIIFLDETQGYFWWAICCSNIHGPLHCNPRHPMCTKYWRLRQTVSHTCPFCSCSALTI